MRKNVGCALVERYGRDVVPASSKLGPLSSNGSPTKFSAKLRAAARELVT